MKQHEQLQHAYEKEQQALAGSKAQHDSAVMQLKQRESRGTKISFWEGLGNLDTEGMPLIILLCMLCLMICMLCMLHFLLCPTHLLLCCHSSCCLCCAALLAGLHAVHVVLLLCQCKHISNL